MCLEEVDRKDINMKPFKVKKKLHGDFFNADGVLDSRIRLRLLDIADDFIETLNIKWVKPKDIVLTGSIANYNWSKYSDIDVHVVYDFKKIYRKTEFVQEYFMGKKDLWNNSHDKLTIKGFPVELSVEDLDAPLHSSGVYSLEKNEWVTEPKEMDDSGLDMGMIRKYCADAMTEMDELFTKIDKEKDRKKLETLADSLKNIIDDAHDKRVSGLKTKAKELSNGNIIWKVIKHMGYTDKVYRYLDAVYDRRNTIDENACKKGKQTVILSEAQYGSIKRMYGPLSKFISIINKALHLNDIYKLNPNSSYDKQLAYAAFFEAGFTDIKKRKNTEDGWMRDMTLSDNTRNFLTQYIKKKKYDEYVEDMNEIERLNNEMNKIKNHDNEVNYDMPAAYMENFINTDDVSSINEGVREYLTEARTVNNAVQVFLKKNPDLNVDELAQLMMCDPTSSSNDYGNFIGDYGMWIGDMYCNGTLTADDGKTLKAALTTYDINKSRMNVNIADVKSFDELCDIVSGYDNNFKAERNISKAERDLEKVYEDDEWVIYIPHSWEADRRIGGDTTWCTAADNNGHYFNHYLNNYGGCYYVNVNKKTGRKYQFHFESGQFNDENNDGIEFDEINPSDGMRDYYFKTLGKQKMISIHITQIR